MTEFYSQIKFQLSKERMHAAGASKPVFGKRFCEEFLIRCNVKTASGVKQFFDLNGQRDVEEGRHESLT
jgi:hypothetical protein